MYVALLNTIKQRMTTYGMSFQPPATPAELKAMQSSAAKELSASIPDGYVAFLEKTNGLDWNGLVIYASQRSPVAGRSDLTIEGFVEGNLNLRDFEPMQNCLVFADDGTVLYVYDLLRNKFEVVTKVGLSVLATFDSFPELISDAFRAVCPDDVVQEGTRSVPNLPQ